MGAIASIRKSQDKSPGMIARNKPMTGIKVQSTTAMIDIHIQAIKALIESIAIFPTAISEERMTFSWFCFMMLLQTCFLLRLLYDK